MKMKMIKFYFLMNILIIFTKAEIDVNYFTHKSVFFASTQSSSTIDENNISSNKFLNEIKQAYKTDLVIMKLEKEYNENMVEFKNNLQLKINKFFVEINICLANLGYKTYFNKILHKFVEIESENGNCYRRIYYTSSTVNAGEKLITKEKEIFNEIVKLIDVDFTQVYEFIVKFSSDFIEWNDYSSYELLFVFNPKQSLFSLHKIFYYFSLDKSLENKNNYYFVSLTKNGNERFDNIFIFYKNTRKVLKYTKNYEHTNKEKISFSDFSTNSLIYEIDLSTLGNESTFHNKLKLNFSDANFMDKNAKTCILVYQHLTEDVYVEKNEFMNYLNKKHNMHILYQFSSEIDQELSSDFVEQYFINFLLCAESSHLKEINYEIDYPVHFRYQPPSTSGVQQAIIPQPYLQIIPDSYENIIHKNTTLTQNLIFNQNILDKESYFLRVKKEQQYTEKFDDRAIFSDEVNLKLKTVINNYNLFIKNKNKMIHNIPVGVKSHFLIVTIITAIVTAMGFLLIFYGLCRKLARILEKPKTE